MLYCQKCQQTYEDGVQRFCLNDGSRLLPAPSSGKSVSKTSGVFASVINGGDNPDEDEFASAPRFSQITFRPPAGRGIAAEEPSAAVFDEIPEPENTAQSNFEAAPFAADEDDSLNEVELELESLDAVAPPAASESILELEPEAERISSGFEQPLSAETGNENSSEPLTAKPTARRVNPNDIATGQALLGDRKINPAGRSAVTWENPQVLIGQTIKGRYQIAEQIGADESAIDYLAEDKINTGKKVVVRVLMDDDAEDSFSGKVFAEERVSLSHVSHPSIVRVIDSGELLEGKPFVITEYVEGESVKSHLQKNGVFDPLRTARIIRQASYALSEVHQSGILHRNLKPENIILTGGENGAEQVKLANFGAPKGKLNQRNLPYKSPEQVEGKLANFASDEFALAVIAYQMLTNRLPFNSTKIGGLLKEQREGLMIQTATLNEHLPPIVDEVLGKALAFNSAERYPKVRDFGDALYNAVSVKPAAEKNELIEESPVAAPMPDVPLISKDEPKTVLMPVVADTPAENVKATEDLAWEKRSSEPPVKNSGSRALFAVLGLVILAAGLFGIWNYFIKQQNQPVPVAPPTVQNVVPVDNAVTNSTAATATTPAPKNEEIEALPMPRTVAQPPNTTYFQNSKDNLSSEAAKNFLGFSLYYPQNWKISAAKNNFLDVSNVGENGLPIEQMLISFYDSKGTFSADRENFPKLLEKSNADLSRALQGNYRVVSQGETKIQNGRWQAFEVKFESSGTAANGEKVTLWGRRLWVPAQLVGIKNGYVITMLATSLSTEVKSVEEVGVKGDLSNILESFEPNQNF